LPYPSFWICKRNSLEKFGVVFEGWVSEKDPAFRRVVEEVLSYLTAADCTYEKDDAIWFSSTKFWGRQR
jgi:arginyl-tRNA synthetase